MHFIGRSIVCERLGIRPSASYVLLPGSGIQAMVRSDAVVSLLNSSRRGREAEVDFIPSDIVTADQLEREYGVPASRFISYAKRKRRPIPHFRITRRVVRFRRSSVEKWMVCNG